MNLEILPKTRLVVNTFIVESSHKHEAIDGSRDAEELRKHYHTVPKI